MLFGVNPAVAERKMPIFSVNAADCNCSVPIRCVNAADWNCNVPILNMISAVSAKENAVVLT